MIFNRMMFVPFGILLPLAYENVLHQDSVKKCNTVILTGLAVSVLVECLHQFTRTGWFEWDDMLHNTIGMMVGYGIYLFIRGRRYLEVHWHFLTFNTVLLAIDGGATLLTCSRDGRVFSVVFIDIDHLKEINDTYGHVFGDVVLKSFVAEFKASFWPPIRFRDMAAMSSCCCCRKPM